MDSSEYSNGFDSLVGTRIVEASGSRVLAFVDVKPHLHQPTGIIHGGVHATLVETTASIGASLWLGDEGIALGLSNTTDFLRAVSEGTLRVEATPIQQGRLMQLWQVAITDEQDRPVASGRLRLLNRRPTD